MEATAVSRLVAFPFPPNKGDKIRSYHLLRLKRWARRWPPADR
jgi:hypothetical protein